MLDPTQPITLPGLPQVTVYGDHDSPTCFYVVPSAPAVAVDDAGKPHISLLIYGRKQGTQLQTLGGQLMLTTTLAVSESDRAAVCQALARRGAGATPGAGAATGKTARPTATPTPRPTPPAKRPPAPSDPAQFDLRSPDWQEGEVRVHLAEGADMTGKPSLMGANQCSLMLSLSAEQADALHKAWTDGLPAATITYQLLTTAASTSSTSSSTQDTAQTTGSGSTTTGSYTGTVETRSTQAVPYPLTISGPLALGKAALQDGMQVLTM